MIKPLLPSTTVGTIEFRSIIEPIRTALSGIQFCQASCRGINKEANIIHCEGALDKKTFDLSYDYLIIAVGAISNTYDIPGVSEHALFLKEISDARKIRQKIIACLERAATPGLETKEQERLLHFVVVGGGPTGVEFAAEMHDFLEEDLYKWFPDLSHVIQITVLEATDQILSSFDTGLGHYTMKIFKRQKIKIRTGSLVKEVREKNILLQDGTSINCGLVIWATGIGPTLLIQSINFLTDPASRLITDKYSRIKNVSNIYAIGDCANMEGKELPTTAQVAQQEGKYVARMLNRLSKGKKIHPFHYRYLGMMAYIGGKKALADLPNVKWHGFGTYIFWRSAYLTRLVSLKNKILVLFDWIKTRIFGRDISRF